MSPETAPFSCPSRLRHSSSWLLPFVIAIVIPAVTGESLGDDAGLARVSLLLGPHENLSTNGRVQLFIFQQFLIVFLLMPVTGAMALAAHAIVGEKQARTLEPLLATPLTTLELLMAKVMGALLPTLAISTVGLVAVRSHHRDVRGAGCHAGDAEPQDRGPRSGRRADVRARLAADGDCDLVARQRPADGAAIRRADRRSGHGCSWSGRSAGLSGCPRRALGFLALGLFGVWILLTLFSVALFERETILTRWR